MASHWIQSLDLNLAFSPVVKPFDALHTAPEAGAPVYSRLYCGTRKVEDWLRTQGLVAGMTGLAAEKRLMRLTRS